jgi:hypothetical protein
VIRPVLRTVLLNVTLQVLIGFTQKVFPQKVPFMEPAKEDGDFFAGTGGFLEPAANFCMEAAAFLEPTEEDGDFFTGVLVSLAAKAGNVVLFI